MMSATSKHTGRKAKKSFTLSSESLEFLEKMRRKRRAASASAVLDDILQSVRLQQKRAELESSIADYYSSLSRGDMGERASWGDFALGEFPDEVSE